MSTLPDIQGVIDRLIAEERTAKASAKTARNGSARNGTKNTPPRRNWSRKATAADDLSDDYALLARAMAADDGGKFLSLWNGSIAEYGGDHSRAVAALVAKLVFWCGPGSVSDRVDRLFRQSRLFDGCESKWDDKHRADGATYGQMTIEKAEELVPDAKRFGLGSSPDGTSVQEKTADNSSAADPSNPTPGTATDEEPDLPRQWDDPTLIADWIIAQDPPRLWVKKTAYEYVGGRYRVVSDEWIDRRVWQACEFAAEAEYLRTEAAKNEHADKIRRVRDAIKKVAEGDETAGVLERLEAKKKTLEQEAKKNADRENVVPKVSVPLASAVTKALKSRCQRTDELQLNTWLSRTGPRVLGCANGLLDLDTHRLLPHTPEWFSTVQIPVAFDASAPPPTRFLAFLEEIMEGDANRIAILQEVSGACLDPDLVFKHFVTLVGDGDNGKTVYLTVLRSLLGSENYSAVGLKEIGASQFGTWPLFGKLANILGDQTFFNSPEEGRLKELTGGEVVKFEQKRRDPIFGPNTAKIIFACNQIPKFSDKSNGTWNRLVAVPFEYTVPAAKKDPRLLTPAYWADELPGVLNLALVGLARFRSGKRLTTSAKCEITSDQHRVDSDPAMEFLLNHYQPGPADAVVLTVEMYASYRLFCVRDGHNRPLAKPTIGRVIPATFKHAKSVKRSPSGTEKKGWSGIQRRPDNPPPKPPTIYTGRVGEFDN